MIKTEILTESFDAAASRRRCLKFRRRMLDISQTVTALHLAGAFSCLEIVDCIYYGLMRRDQSGDSRDTFLLSKGHGSLAQYVVLEDLGILPREQLDNFCRPGYLLGTHPDFGIPGIEAATGSLGHGLPIAVGMALADKVQAFGWEAVEVDGHDQQTIFNAVSSRSGNAPMMIIARTIKGKGVSYMENVPIWHYRSPSPEEYQQALAELSGEEEA